MDGEGKGTRPGDGKASLRLNIGITSKYQLTTIQKWRGSYGGDGGGGGGDDGHINQKKHFSDIDEYSHQ